MDSEAWLCRINRGSLSVIFDDAFALFIAIEKRLRDTLPTMLVKQNVSVDHFKENILKKAVMSLWTDVTRNAEKACSTNSLASPFSLISRINTGWEKGLVLERSVIGHVMPGLAWSTEL